MKDEVTKVVLVGGGTGGHVTPLVALAKEIKTRHPRWQIHYLGASNDAIGQRLTDQTNLFRSRHFVAAGKWHRFGQVKKREFFYFWRSDFWLNLVNFFLFQRGFWQSLFYFRRLKPQLLFSKGGYVAVGPCLAARILKIPLVLHDSDAVSGTAHAFFKHYAHLRLSGFQTSSTSRADADVRHVGVPVNPVFGEELAEGKREELLAKYNLPGHAKFILVTGGGGGARNLNQGVLEVIDRLKLKVSTYFIIIAGNHSYEETLEKAQVIKSSSRVRVVQFADDMPDLMRACHGVITRAGATILTEISLAQKAAIVVPNPLLPRAHQVHNARIYQRAQAAWLVSDSGQSVNQRALRQALNELVHSNQKRRRYENKVGQLALPDAAVRCLEAVEEVLAPVIESARTSRAASSRRRRAALLSPAQIKRRARRYQLVRHRIILGFKIMLLAVVVGGVLFKLFYIGRVEVVALQASPLLTEERLANLEVKMDRFLEGRNLWQRYFSLPTSDLRRLLLEEGYIEEVAFTRDLVGSRVSIFIQPKYILGNFEAPNARTIITTDGYVIQGYEELQQRGHYTLTVKSGRPIDGRQELVLSPLDISFLNQIKDYLAAQGVLLEEARISSQPREIIFRLRDYDFDIIALTSRDPIEQGIALVTALEFFERAREEAEAAEIEAGEDGEEPSAPAREVILPQEYIDIRLIDRVIYK